MDIRTFFLTVFAIWQFKKYIPTEYFLLLLEKINIYLKNYHESLNNVKTIPLNNLSETSIITPKPKVNYEDKYLEAIRKLDKEYKFTEEEEKVRLQKYLDTFKSTNECYREKINEIEQKLINIETKIIKYDGSDDDFCMYDKEEEDSHLGETKEERIKLLLNDKNILTEEREKYKYFIETTEGQRQTMKDSEELSVKYIIDQRLDKLNNCYIIENTPLGNVLMIYDTKKISFRYYSDNTIPYRYLETVARKYVKQYNCRPIFIDMEEELKLSEERFETEKKEKEETEKKREESVKNNQPIEEKKNVFTKFKSYNKDTGSGKTSYAAPPKNSISTNKKIISDPEKEKEKQFLKDKANRYTYEGKFANFSFIKKVDRKVVDKKFGMTFADFKKMKKDKND
jgi:hypothetical protein